MQMDVVNGTLLHRVVWRLKSELRYPLIPLLLFSDFERMPFKLQIHPKTSILRSTRPHDPA